MAPHLQVPPYRTGPAPCGELFPLRRYLRGAAEAGGGACPDRL